jgi:hypothetical protein
MTEPISPVPMTAVVMTGAYPTARTGFPLRAAGARSSGTSTGGRVARPWYCPPLPAARARRARDTPGLAPGLRPGARVPPVCSTGATRLPAADGGSGTSPAAQRPGWPTRAQGGATMPSQAMQDLIGALREQQKASAGRAAPTLAERRASFAPAGRLHPVPDDVRVREVTAGGGPARWLTAPGADAGRVLLLLHGGGFELGSLRSDGELAARVGRASGMRVLFPEYRLAPEHPFPAAVDDVLAAWHWLRTDQGLGARSVAVAGGSAGGGRSRGRRHPGGRRGPAPRLPDPARHPRSSRGHRTNREVPASPGSLTRQSAANCERQSSDAS